MDITLVLNTLIKLGCAVIIAFVIPWIQEKKKNQKVANAIQIADEVAKIARTVVSAANELDITGDLIKLGKSKAEQALESAEKELALKGIIYDKEQLVNEIKAAVTELRVYISGTDAEKEK